MLIWTMHAQDKTSNAKTVGLRVPKKYRSALVKTQPLILHLLRDKEHTTVKLVPEETFWTLNGELTHLSIRKWIDLVYGLKNWESARTRPKVYVWALGNQSYAVLGLTR